MCFVMWLLQVKVVCLNRYEGDSRSGDNYVTFYRTNENEFPQSSSFSTGALVLFQRYFLWLKHAGYQVIRRVREKEKYSCLIEF